MMAFAALVIAAVMFKLLGHQVFTPLSVCLAAALLLLRPLLTAPQRVLVERFLLQFGVLIYALANQDPSYYEHLALLLCLVPALPTLARWRELGHVALAEGSVLAVLAFIVWSVCWTSNLSMSAAGYAMSALCLVFLMAYVLQHEGDLKRVFAGVLGVLAALLVGSFLVGAMGHGSAGKTFSGVTLHRNQLGFLLGLMILLCLFAVRERFRWLALLGGVVAAGLLVFIDSKSAIIAVTLTAVVFVVITARRWKLYLGVLGLALVLLFVALPSPKMDNFALAVGRDPTFTSRTEIWADSLRLAAQQPWTGYGYNAVWSAHENRLSQFPDAPGPRYAHAHNAWIDWVLQLGVGGWAVYLLFLGVLLVRAWRHARLTAAPVAPASAPISQPLALHQALQTVSLVLYIQVYDLANVSTVPVTRFGFFMLAATSLCLWLARRPHFQRAWAHGGPTAAGLPARRRRAATGLAWAWAGLAGLAAASAYAIWEDGREFAAAEKRGAPAPGGVTRASLLDAGQFQWRTPEKLRDYARRHQEGLMEQLRRSESP